MTLNIPIKPLSGRWCFHEHVIIVNSVVEQKTNVMIVYLCLGCPLFVSICTEAPFRRLTSHPKRAVLGYCAKQNSESTYLSKNIGEGATPINGKSHVPLRHSGNPECSLTVLRGPSCGPRSSGVLFKASVSWTRQRCR